MENEVKYVILKDNHGSTSIVGYVSNRADAIHFCNQKNVSYARPVYTYQEIQHINVNRNVYSIRQELDCFTRIVNVDLSNMIDIIDSQEKLERLLEENKGFC